MKPIFEYIENNDYDNFVRLIQEDPSVLDELDEDGWSVLSLTTHYEQTAAVEFLLPLLNEEQVNKSGPFHPLLLALENLSPLVDTLINSNKIDYTIHDKGQDNLLMYAQEYNRLDLIDFLLEKGVDPFQENVAHRSAISLCIENNDLDTFDKYSQDENFSFNYKDDYITKSILHNASGIFSRLLPHNTLPLDNLFSRALDFSRVQIISTLMDTGEILLGSTDIPKLVDIMCIKYENEKDTKASLNIADFLFEIKVPFNKFVNEDGQSAWLLAIENDNEDIFEKLVDTNESINITDDNQKTPLLYAIEKNKPHYVQSILKRGASLSSKDRNQSTPLIQAVRYGNIDVINTILKSTNVYINEININKETALSLAVQKKRMDIASALIWRGAEISSNPAKFTEETNVYQIGFSGNYEKVYDDIVENEINSFMALTKLGFNLNQTNEDGDTFALRFIKQGYLSNFKAILKCSFNPNKTDKNGNSALMCAMSKNSDEYAVSLLWKFHNIDYDIKNKYDETVYDLAAECGSIVRIRALLQYDPKLTEENVNKILHVVGLSGNFKEDISLLEPHTTALDKYTDSFNNNLLMLSVLGNNVENFSWLLNNEKLNFDLDAQNYKGDTVSSFIEKSLENSEIFKTLFEAHVNSKKNKSNQI